jgi:hypothetical protein
MLTGGRLHIQRVYLLVLVLGLLSAPLSGCVTLPDPESTQDNKTDTIGQATPTQTIGQSFVSRRARLEGIGLWLSTDDSDGTLVVELFHRLDDPSPLSTLKLNFGDIVDNEVTQIKFPTQDDPPYQSYFIQLKTETGTVRVLGSNQGHYPKGRAHLNGEPIEGDIAFRVSYDYNWKSVLDDLGKGFDHWWVILPLGILLVLPGWHLLSLSGSREHFGVCQQIAISVGLSLAIVPLLMLWTTTFGLSLARYHVWIIAIVLLVITLLHPLLRRLRIRPLQPPRLEPEFIKRQSPPLIWIALLAILTFSLFVRMAMVRDLAAPAWVDSVHHGLLTRLILETGALPSTYSPFFPPEVNNYHVGFHSMLAFFQWLSGWELPEAMLLFGQVLNALTILAVFLLTTTLLKDETAGVFAALIAGLMTPMPAYYASWGRYTQLAGLLVLPVGLVWVQQVIEANESRLLSKKNLPLFLINSITLAGTFLIHYRVITFLGCLLLAYLVGQTSLRKIPKALGYLLWTGLGSVVLTFPWLIPAIADLLIPKATLWINEATAISEINWRYLTPALGQQSLILAGVGLVWGLIRRQRFVLTLVLWVGLLFVLANPGLLGLPDAGFVNPTSVEISLFMPIAVLGGYVFSQIIQLWKQALPAAWTKVGIGIFVLGIPVLAIFAATKLLPTLNPVTFLFREADRPAMTWITENIPLEETILINPEGWGYGLYIGHDGGYWIAPLTGRQTLPPPLLYGLGAPEYIRQTNETIEEVIASNTDPPRLWELMQKQDIQYIYLGGRGGMISADALNVSPLFEVRYTRQGVWVFEALPEEK